MLQAITIRRATEADRAGLQRLAALDGGHTPEGEALLALVDGELRAARGLDGSELADPFHLSGELMQLLRLRAAQEERDGDRGGRARGRIRRHAILRRAEAAA